MTGTGTEIAGLPVRLANGTKRIEGLLTPMLSWSMSAQRHVTTADVGMASTSWSARTASMAARNWPLLA